MSDQFAQLLQIVGRDPSEPCTILTQEPGGAGLTVEWTTVAEAPVVASKHAGIANVWYGVQPLRLSGGRGKGNDVTGVRTLYADLDDKNMTRAQAMSIIGHLSNTLGVGCPAIVVSGGGLQPYWPIDQVDPITGADVLMWWREQVIAAAGVEGVSVDTGVYDLARILRVPGPANMKPAYGPEGARTGLIRTGSGWRVSNAELLDAMIENPVAGKSRAARPAGVAGVFRDRGTSAEDRVFTREQFQAYLEVNPGKVRIARETPHGAGFNTALNEACFDIAAGVPELISEEQAWDLAYSIVEAQFPGGPDGNDVATIRSGFSQNRWTARAATEEEKGDPFSPYRDLETIAKKQGGLKGPGKTSVKAQASREQVLAADAAVASVADGLDSGSDSSGVVITSDGQIAESELEDRWQARIAEQEARGYWLPDEFWESPECRALAHIRSSARAAGVSPEGVLLSSMAEVAVRIMPNVKIPDYVKTPASLSFGVLLVGGSGSDKSSSVDMSQEIFEWRGMGDWESHYFGLSSSQGIAGQYQHWHKDRNQPGYMRRDRWSAMADEDEGDKIAALCEKNGLDLVSAIRSALMGKLLGAGNVGETKTNLPKHSYRFVMRICTLPAHCAWVLSDDVGGLPQRLLWACVEDARVFVESPPGKFPIALPAEFLLDPISGALRPEFMLTADEEVRAEVVRDSELRKKLGVSKLDEHALLTKMKVAWILAAMHGRSHVRVDVEWRLAEMVMQMSNAARGFAQAEVQRAALERAQAEALRKGRGRVIEESVVRAHDETGDRKRAADAVIRMLGRNVEQGMTKGELRAKLKADIRHLLDEGVLDGLIEAGQIRYEDIVEGGRQIGSRWFLTCG